MVLPKLITMPALKKSENGYLYDEKYVGKLYQMQNKIVFFKKNSYDEYSLDLLKLIEDQILNTLKDKYITKEDSKKQITEENKKYITNDNHEFVTKSQLEVQSSIISNLNQKIQELETKIKGISTKTEIQEIIDKKLVDVHTNFQNIINDLIEIEIKKALGDSNRKPSGKIKFSTLVMMKELGYKPEDIKTLSENGLI